MKCAGMITWSMLARDAPWREYDTATTTIFKTGLLYRDSNSRYEEFTFSDNRTDDFEDFEWVEMVRCDTGEFLRGDLGDYIPKTKWLTKKDAAKVMSERSADALRNVTRSRSRKIEPDEQRQRTSA